MKSAFRFKNDGPNNYILEFDDDNAYVRGGTSCFAATLEHAAANGVLHAIIEDVMVDHKIDYTAWCDINDYVGNDIPTVDKWENIPHDYESNKCNFLRRHNE